MGFEPSQLLTCRRGLGRQVLRGAAWTPTDDHVVSSLKAPQCMAALVASSCGSGAGAQFLRLNAGRSAVAWAEH